MGPAREPPGPDGPAAALLNWPRRRCPSPNRPLANASMLRSPPPAGRYLPDPDVVARDIAEDRRAALAQFEEIAADLGGTRQMG